MNRMSNKQIGALLKGSTLTPVIIVLFILVIINMVLQPRFFSYMSFRINISSFTPLILAAMAQAIVILMGYIDLSIGASITLINVVLAVVMQDTGLSVAGALGYAVLIGVGTGVVNGLVIGILNLPSMVATFATASVWFGISLLIMPQPGGYIPPFFYRLYKQAVFSLPVPFLIVVFACLLWFVVAKRPFFRHLYAVGGNAPASEASGINVNKIRLQGFVLSGIFTALAAIVVTCQAASGDASIGNPFTLPSIAAVSIGGIAFCGGKGRMAGAILGALVFGFLDNVVFFADIPSLYQEFIKGSIIIIALMVAVIPNLKRMSLRGE